MLTDAQKIDIRRFCGYPVYGGQPVQAFGYRFFQWYGTLEFRMSNLAPGEETVVVNTYLANLNTLEQAIPGTSANLDTDTAAVWKHNANEQRDRDRLFDSWRRRLCGFFGIPPGPSFVDGSSGSISLVV
ncbi:hypothetical protein [Burkholderia vietnamiensis]|uniref:hypothetical protein n=1 Tax=Burkholderia vietnamiensis TaxID=60552 RepID=UPI00158DB762|nr:hypothetical protein [Burkholderia vietnamiensis]